MGENVKHRTATPHQFNEFLRDGGGLLKYLDARGQGFGSGSPHNISSYLFFFISR